MNLLANFLIAFIALEHLYILYMEMFAWTTLGKKTFKSMPESLFEPTKVLAANQGLYNGFLSAGLIWSLFISDNNWHLNTALFFSYFSRLEHEKVKRKNGSKKSLQIIRKFSSVCGPTSSVQDVGKLFFLKPD